MRAYRKMIAPVALAVMWSANAWALGGLATPDGSGAIRATRVLVVRGADEVRVIAQMRYQGTPGTAVWLVPLPDFSQPADQGVRGEAFAQAGFDTLDEATRPTLEGECDGMPTGASQAITQIDQYGPANQMVLPTRFFTVNDIVMGNLTNYLDGLGIVADETMAAAISDTIDQNFMLAAVRIDTADLGVDRIDPIVRLRYPSEPGDQVKLGLRMLVPSTTGNAADVVLYSLDRSRMRVEGFTTDELSYDGIRFISPGETDYTQAFDMQVAARQSQRFIYEFAGPVDDGTFADAEVSGLISGAGATFLTRLRARMIPAALRSNLAFIELGESGAAAVDRTHAVEGFMCGGPVDPDMGPDPMEDMGPDPMEDMGTPDPEPTADGGGLVADAGDDDDDGGGGSSGCAAAPGTADGWPAALLISFCLLLPGLRRRR